mgnify:CR=1 FL=1
MQDTGPGIDENDAAVPLRDTGLLHGAGVFTTARSYRGVVFERWRHVHGCGRWFNAARDTVRDRFLAFYTDVFDGEVIFDGDSASACFGDLDLNENIFRNGSRGGGRVREPAAGPTANGSDPS